MNAEINRLRSAYIKLLSCSVGTRLSIRASLIEVRDTLAAMLNTSPQEVQDKCESFVAMRKRAAQWARSQK